MNVKTDLIKKESPDIWKWAGTEISGLTCSETLIDEMIELWKQRIEENGRELLDVHVFKWPEQGFGLVNIEFLSKPKQKNEM